MAESTQQQKRQKKSKKYYGGTKKRKFEDKLCVGMRGILVFGADNEAMAKREAYNVLNEYADELFGSEFLDNVLHRDVNKKLVVDYQHGAGEKIIVENKEDDESTKEDNVDENKDELDNNEDEYDDDDEDEDEEEEEEDIEKAIAKEIDQIKNIKKERRFQGVSTGVHAIIFIKSTLSNDKLNKLVHCILSDLEKTKQKKSRSFQRLIPVTEICHANLDSIRKTVTEKILPEFNGDDETSLRFCVNYKSRFNNTVTRNEVLSEIAGIFKRAGHTVDLTSPDKVILVEVMKGLCCMNILKDFFRFKKYNVHAITNDPKDNSNESYRPNDPIPEEREDLQSSDV